MLQHPPLPAHRARRHWLRSRPRALPATAKAAVYERLREVLSARDSTSRYNMLSSADRTAIVEILRDTKQDLPTYWFSGS